jgi:broad specificity phosphatase PhoE
LLVRHAPTSATRAAGFPEDESIDARARAEAATLADSLPRRFEALCSPALRCLQTADAAGVADPSIVPALAECDFGAWAGRTLADVAAAAPADVGAWMEDADACPHGGESLSAFAARVGRWLDGEAARGGSAVAFTHGGVVKAALVHALGAPLSAFWRIDVAPLSLTELHVHAGRWTVVRVNVVVGGAGRGAVRGVGDSARAARGAQAAGDAQTAGDALAAGDAPGMAASGEAVAT